MRNALCRNATERGVLFFGIPTDGCLIRVRNSCGVCPKAGTQDLVVVAGQGEMSAVRCELEEDVVPHRAFSACAERSSMLTSFLDFIGQPLLRMREWGELDGNGGEE